MPKAQNTKHKVEGKGQAKPAVRPEVLPAEGATRDYSHLPTHEQAAYCCKDKIEDAHKRAHMVYYDMSLGLLEAYENDYAPIWGCANFAEYVEKNLDMKYRQAYYMVDAGKVIRKLSLPREQVERIGWTKMRAITDFINAKPEDASRYLDMAERMSRTQLQAALEGEVNLQREKQAKPAVMRLSLKLEGDAANVVSEALTIACEDIGREDVGLAFHHIAGEWMMARGATPKSTPLEDWLAFLRKVYNVDLVRAEDAGNIDALLAGGVTNEDDEEDAIAKLLASTEDDVHELVK